MRLEETENRECVITGGPWSSLTFPSVSLSSAGATSPVMARPRDGAALWTTSAHHQHSHWKRGRRSQSELVWPAGQSPVPAFTLVTGGTGGRETTVFCWTGSGATSVWRTPSVHLAASATSWSMCVEQGLDNDNSTTTVAENKII